MFSVCVAVKIALKCPAILKTLVCLLCETNFVIVFDGDGLFTMMRAWSEQVKCGG